jgi:hypothetical protein
MKKIALFVPLCLCTLLGAKAQDSLQVKAQDSLQVVADDDYFKARRGRLATELNVNPFQGSLSLNNAINQIKFRYFASDGLALRLAFTVTTLKNETGRSQPYGQNPINQQQTRQTTTAGVNLGLERHFRGTRRLSPYVGAEVTFTDKSSSDDIKTDFSETKVKGAWQNTWGNPGTDYTERGFVRYGFNVISGFDFYMARHFYLGYEFAFGLASTKYKDVDVNTIYTSNPPPINPGGSTLVKSDEKSFTAGPVLLNGIRIGYVF